MTEDLINTTEAETQPDFVHLHVHTQFSILDGAAPIDKLFKKALASGIKGVAITDHGNMYGVMNYMKEINKINDKRKEDGLEFIKPIIGCEFYVAEGSRHDKNGREDRSGHHLILIAKNKEGYHNLSRLCSLGFIEGFYYTPRIDKEILRLYGEHLIAMSACLGGEIPSAILENNIPKAEAALREYMEIFGEDFYLELQNHGLEDQATVNKELMRLSQKYMVKLVASNDVHFVNAEDADAHDILVCLNTKKDYNDETRMKYSGEEYLKTPEEMAALFKQVPEAIANTMEIFNKIEPISIKEKIMVPKFPLPEGFDNDNEYLSFLTNEGAQKLYPVVTDEIQERIDYELAMIEKMDFPGYFLIVQDFINEARRIGVAVGPGRGSAAGSIVAFCTRITTVDPIKYNLLFERFLNPDRKTMPDIDIDFDDDGRDKVIEYVINKYGKERVAQIVTFGTMAAKSSVKNVARVLGLHLNEANRLSNLIPSKPGTTLADAFKEVPELAEEKNSPNKLIAKTLEMAEIMEGLSSHVGVHACGVIIGPEDLINHVPLSRSKDTELVVTQYDGKFVEEAGMLKMDFLGLKTLSIIKDALENIEKSHKISIDIETVPLDDKKTFDLYRAGDTVGTFQFESTGMRAYLKELKPTEIEDLIIMNALYRPGPMDNIPLYIRRKHGKEKAEYLHPIIEDIIRSTHGIMIFQEQIMQIAQKMAGFSLAEADNLRRAMGKKKIDEMKAMLDKFVSGAVEKGVEEKTAHKVFETMEKFAEYGFNRSHSAAYSILAYKTAYLKANYPADYMAAVLTHNLSDIKKITFFIDECRRQGIEVLSPDVNESALNFNVNSKGAIRFGMGGIKNVGENAAKAIIEERDANGFYKDLFDFIKRVNLRNVNKRCVEALAFSGAFDCFGEAHRAQYFHKPENEDVNFIEKVIRFGNNYQTQLLSSQASLFGDTATVDLPSPEFPYCEPWSDMEKLKSEKEVIGFFITGHPLDTYNIEIEKFCNYSIQDFKENMKQFADKEIRFAGIVCEASHKTSKNGKPYGAFAIEDRTDTVKINLFGQEYLNFKSYIENDYFLFLKARVQKRFNNENDLELKVHYISLLPDLLETNVNCVMLRAALSSVNESLIDRLHEAARKSPGKCKIQIQVTDTDEQISLNFISHIKVNPAAFIKEIGLIEELSYKLS